MSLALATLLYEWRRYSAAMVALAVAGLLILAQVGMFTGIVKGVTATLDRSRADLIIMPAKMESLINSGGGSLPARLQPQMYMHPEVAEVAAWDIEGGRWVNHPKDGKKAVTTFVDVNMVDTRPGAVTLPVDFTEETRRALMEPYSVAIDESQLGRLGVKLGDTASLNGKTIRVRAILTGYPNINNASITVSRDTLRLLGMVQKNGKTGPLMVRLKDPARAEVVRDQLNKSAKDAYRAWTRTELAEANEGALMKEQIIGLFISFSVVIGFAIGCAITSMTLRGAILSSIKEFASLRALGVPMSALQGIVFELSLWVGVAGLAFTAVLMVGIYLLALNGGVPMGFPLVWDLFVAVLLLVIAGASGLFSLGVLKKSQPADPPQMSMTNTAISAHGLYKRFKTGRTHIEVLKRVDFDALHGDVTMVMGPSGSGKSTLVATLSGLLKPDEGQVTGMGEDLWALKSTKLDRFRLDHCGFIFQGFNLFAALTALQQVEIILKYKGMPKRQAREKAAHALTEVGLESKLNQRPSELSGGEKQRVAIARALAKDPQLIFADEPTSALDGENGQIVIKLLHRAAKQHGAAVICVTHDPRLETYADRVIHLEDGRILDDRRTEHAANVSGAAHLKPALIGA